VTPFDGRFVICDRRMVWLSLVTALEEDEAARLRGIFGLWVVFELLSEEPPSPAGPVAAR
jgi:hypothetical protein